MNKSDTHLSCNILQCLNEKHVNHSIIDYNLVEIKDCDIHGHVRTMYVYIHKLYLYGAY